MTGAPSQFGADAAWIRQSPDAFAGTAWAEVIGFHIYMGTNITAPETLFRTFEVATATAAELAEVLGIEPQIVDLGGGFGHPFAASGPRPDFSALREPLENLLDERLPAWRGDKLQIAFESGRYLVGDAGTLYCTVQDVKLSQGRSFVVLDTGIHHLGGMAGLRRVPRIGVELVPVGHRSSAASVEGAQIVGPLCTPLDHLAQGVDLPDVQPGDMLAIPNVGAYGLTGSLIGFLSRETPVEIVLDGAEVIEASRVELIRRALS
jgi:diaminopimelate decarboxylase